MKSHQKIILTTNNLHSDTKKTLVEIDKKFYELVLTDLTWDQIRKLSYEETPHVRHLNPIPERTPAEQKQKEKEARQIHELAKRCSQSNEKISSVRKAIQLGADVPKEVERLLKEKDEAKQKGDDKKIRQIRKQLRKLDYKRYTNKKGEDNEK